MNSIKVPLIAALAAIVASGYFYYRIHFPQVKAVANRTKESARPAPKPPEKPNRTAVPPDPARAESLFKEAIRLRGESKPAEAVEKLSRAIDYNPDYFEAYMIRATMRAEDIQDNDGVLSDVDEMLRLNPRDPEVYNLRSSALQAKGANPLAVAAANKAIALAPDNWIYYNTRGCAYNNMAKYNQAINDFTRAIDLKPEEILARSNRASVYAFLGKYDLARADLDEIARIEPALKKEMEDLKIKYQIPPK